MLSPGIAFLLSYAPFVSAPFAGGYIVQYILRNHFDVVLSKPIMFLSTIFCFPLVLFGSIIWTDFSEARQAKSMGASLLPVWPARWPGHSEKVLFLLAMFKDRYPGEGMGSLLEEYGGTFNMRLLWRNQLVSMNPDHIKAIVATDFNNYEKGHRLFSMLESVLGTGVFNSDGEMWKFHRSMTRPFFHKDQISQVEYLSRLADVAIVRLKERLRAGHAVDFQDLASRFTMDSSMTFLFGTCVNSLADSLPYPHNILSILTKQTEAEAFSQAFLQAQVYMSQRSLVGPVWPLREIFGDRTAKHMKVINSFVEPIVKTAVERQRAIGGLVDKEKLTTVEEGETLLDHLVKHTEDPKILKDEVLNILLASRDTTAATLTFATYMMAEHPDMLARLRKEVVDKIGPSASPTYEDLKEMKYLRAFINETLRLYPPLPFNYRQSINATTLKPSTLGGKPLYVPPNTVFAYTVFFMHRRKDLWGPDAEDFDPDRFLDDRLQKYLIPNPHIFLPFNAGPRICLGQQFAYNQTSFLLVRLLQNFDAIRLDADAQPPESKPPKEWASRPGRERVEKIRPKVHITMYSQGGLWVRMHETEETPVADA